MTEKERTQNQIQNPQQSTSQPEVKRPDVREAGQTEQGAEPVAKQPVPDAGRKKKVSVLIPCYNEEENVVPMSRAITELFTTQLTQYDWELIFIDNDSTDNTRPLLREIVKRNHHVKAILNAKNFGQFNSPYYGILQTTGDCTISMVCDFQDPLELIPQYLDAWEQGYKIVIGVKTASRENPFIYHMRSLYYHFVRKFSDVEQIEHFTGSGLYDRSFVEVLRNLKDPTPFLRGIVAELGYRIKEIPYTQPKRRAGKTHNNFFTLYDAAMLSITSYTKMGLRVCSFLGAIISLICFILAIVYLVMKLIYWQRFEAGMAPIIISMLFLGGIIIFFIGFMGEYIMSINKRVMNRPLVIEEERIGDWDSEENGTKEQNQQKEQPAGTDGEGKDSAQNLSGDET